jgi:hypothetical protein
MTDERKIVLDGFITLEGRFLEKLWAAYLMTQYKTVRERLETGGYHHDILFSDGVTSTLCECTGQQQMTPQKIEKLGRDAFLIRDAIRNEGETPLKKVILIAALNRNSWSKEVSETFEIQRGDLDAYDIKLEKAEDYDVLLPLINEGILGFALIQNKLYPVGPEEYGIRFDKSKGEFRRTFASIDIDKFKRLPQSFLPSLYWGTFYKELQEKWAKEELEEPLNFQRFWYPYSYGGFGIKFKSAENMRDLYRNTYYVKRHVFEDYKDNVLVGVGWSRKYTYPTAYGFESRDYVDRSEVSTLLGRISSAVRTYRDKRSGTTERFGIHVVTASADWTPQAWWEVRKTAREDVYVHEVLRGEDSLIKLLNESILGFAFSDIDYSGNIVDTSNQIKLVGPGIPALRLKDRNLSRELLS